jgi:hypothetical protein
MVQPVKSGWHRHTVLNLQVRFSDELDGTPAS